MPTNSTPVALIDTVEYLDRINVDEEFILKPHDFNAVINFLKIYDGNTATFESYRRELERLLQWAWLIEKKSILDLSRKDIENYIQFCLKPPAAWIGKKRVARFIDQEGMRMASIPHHG